MARINLLPWRAERRKQRQREFYGMLGFAAVAGVVLSFLLWFYYSQQISGQEERNGFLRAEIEKVKEQNKKIEKLDQEKDRLLARKKVIEELQAKRSQMVHLFDSLVRTIPDGVVLTALKQEGDILTLEGRTQSNARVSAYMRNLEGSGWMTNPELSIIEAKALEKAGEASSSLIDAKSLPYMFEVKVKLPAPDEKVEVVAAEPEPEAATPVAPAAEASADSVPAAAGQEQATPAANGGGA